MKGSGIERTYGADEIDVRFHFYESTDAVEVAGAVDYSVEERVR